MTSLVQECLSDITRRHEAIRAATNLIENLTREDCEWVDQRDMFILLGGTIGADQNLLLMACHSWQFEQGKRALSLLNGMTTGQPKEVLQRLHAELGEVL